MYVVIYIIMLATFINRHLCRGCTRAHDDMSIAASCGGRRGGGSADGFSHRCPSAKKKKTGTIRRGLVTCARDRRVSARSISSLITYSANRSPVCNKFVSTRIGDRMTRKMQRVYTAGRRLPPPPPASPPASSRGRGENASPGEYRIIITYRERTPRRRTDDRREKN